MILESTWMDNLLRPLEGNRIEVAGCSEVVDGLAHLTRVGGAEAAQHRTREDAEPDFNLVEPRGVRRSVVEMDFGVTREPEIMFGLVRIEVVQDDVKLGVRVEAEQPVHEVEKLDSPASLVMGDVGDASVDFERREQRCCAMSLVLEALPSQGTAVREAQPALGTFENLDGWLFIHAYDQRAFRRIEVKSHDVCRLRRKLRVGADAPTATALQLDTMLTKHAPHLILGHVPQGLGYEATRPGRVAFQWRLIQRGQNATFRVLAVNRRLARTWIVNQTRKSVFAESATPLADRRLAQTHLRGDLLSRRSRRPCQDDAGSLRKALLRGPLPGPRGQLGTLFVGQYNRSRDASHGRSVNHNVDLCK